MGEGMNLGIVETITLAIAALALLVVCSIVWTSWRNGITPTPTSPSVMRAVAEEVNRLNSEGVLVEAGSGWGTLGLYLGRHCKNWRVEGVENSPVPLILSKLAAWIAAGSWRLSRREGPGRSVSFRRGNLYDVSYREADAVVAYLYSGAMRRFGPLLAEQLRPGAHVVSVCFALPDWQPERVVTCSDLYRTMIYVYRK